MFIKVLTKRVLEIYCDYVIIMCLKQTRIHEGEGPLRQNMKKYLINMKKKTNNPLITCLNLKGNDSVNIF